LERGFARGADSCAGLRCAGTRSWVYGTGLCSRKKMRIGGLLLGIALASAFALCCAIVWYSAFTRFISYDDEGDLRLSGRHLLNCPRPYDEIPVFYGPAYYLVRWTIHAGLGVPLTHEWVRLISAAFRLATALVGATAVRRITRSAPLGIASLILLTA